MARVTHLSTKIAAASLARHAQSLTHADDLGSEAEAVVQHAWNQILKLLHSLGGPHHALSVSHHIQLMVRSIEPALVALFADRLEKTARLAYDHTAAAVVDHVPIRRLRATLTEARLTREAVVANPLGVPDYRQSEDYDCGAAAVHAVANYFGVGRGRVEVDYIRELGTTETNGTQPRPIIDWLQREGLVTASKPGMTIEDLDRYCASGRPVICSIQWPQAASPARQYVAGHYVVVIGVGMGKVIYQDPLAGRQVIDAESFDAHWHDVEPGGVVYDHYGIAVGRRNVVRLLEDDDSPAIRAGFIQVGPGGATATSVFDRADLSDDAKKDLMRQLIFPPPPQREVFGVVYAGDWRQRLANQTRLAAPQKIARVVMDGATTGRSIGEIAKDLQPVVNGVKSSARRIARNENLNIAHTMQWKAWQEVDELINGYQVFAVDQGHSPESRPEHRRRHGTVYYKKPKSGQRSLSDLPHPPHEADGSLAENCRCWISPTFTAEEEDPENAHPSTALDPEVAGEWFDQAGERDRRAAVGAQAYNLVKQETDREPEWDDFVDNAGRVLTYEQLFASFKNVLFKAADFTRF